jgi:hypothetical protein
VSGDLLAQEAALEARATEATADVLAAASSPFMKPVEREAKARAQAEVLSQLRAVKDLRAAATRKPVDAPLTNETVAHVLAGVARKRGIA